MAIDYIAYSPNHLFIIIPSFLSIIMNAIFIVHFIFKLNFNKTKNKMSSLEKLLLPLSILESMISICWFLSGILFETEKQITDGMDKCKIFGLFQTFCYIFDWLLVYFALTHLKNMILNPISYILKSGTKIRKYLLMSGGTALILSIVSYFMNIVGKSPMLTCFLSLQFYFINDNNYSELETIIRLIILALICFIPVITLIFGIMQIIIVCLSDSYKNDKENRKIFKDHSLYLLIYFIITFFLSSLYMIEVINDGKIEDNIFLENYFFLVSIMICVTPLIVGVIRLIQTDIIKKIYRKIKQNCCSKARISNNNEKNIMLKSLINEETTSTFEQFESSAIEKFVMNIYIAVCFCLEKNINQFNINYEDLNDNMYNETIQYEISKKIIIKDLENSYLINDTIIKLREEFSISCVEFAPQIFRYLRKLDGVKEEIIVQSMLPMNNKIGISETEGKGGSFFINSDDHEFILKTITFEELEIIRKLLLNRMVEHFHNNNDSIISRVYGVYKISMHNGIFKEDEIYFILMKNVIGTFYDNLICKYDLKGSSLNRKVKYENVDTKVMKDLNFNEAEQVFLLNKENSQKLLDIATKDANFFCSSGIMDYSLLVAKISLNNEEIKFLFGKDHRKNAEKEFFNMAGKERVPSMNQDEFNNLLTVKSNNENKNNNDDKGLRFVDTNIECLRKYFFPSLKGDVLYIMSIIDFFQLYNLQKNIEAKLKIITKRVKAQYISSIPPVEYKNRFIEFVKKKTDSEKYIKDIYNPENKNDF